MSDREIKEIFTEDAPRPVGPYSQAVSAGEYVFVSGQIPLDRLTGETVEGNITAQTRQVISNLENILGELGIGLDRVVKTEVFLLDMNDFSAMNAVYASKFTGAAKPARCVVQASRLPRDVRIEMSCIAYKN